MEKYREVDEIKALQQAIKKMFGKVPLSFLLRKNERKYYHSMKNKSDAFFDEANS